LFQQQPVTPAIKPTEGWRSYPAFGFPVLSAGLARSPSPIFRHGFACADLVNFWFDLSDQM
jgi:hypothetical protein